MNFPDGAVITAAMTPQQRARTSAPAAASGAASPTSGWHYDAGPKRFRLAVDDNIYFLRDIARQRYASLFDCPYLAMLRRLQRDFGVKTVLNCFYETPAGDFNLSDFPDRYRAEWRDQAHWLQLAFHARAEFPARPYAEASAADILGDWDLVGGEIERFAGEALWSPTTVIHWCMTPAEVLPALAGRGVRCLSGLFRRGDDGWDLNYGLDDQRTAFLSNHDALIDHHSGIVMSRIDLVLNSTEVTAIVPALAALAAHPGTAQIMDLLTHEQYSWPFYKDYLPDHEARLRTAASWCREHDYQPAFFHEGLLGARQNH